MSYEGRVMSSEMILEIIPETAVAIQGKGALGTRWFHRGHIRPDAELGLVCLWPCGARILANHRIKGCM